MLRSSRTGGAFALAVLLLAFLVSPAFAHKGFITTYSHHIEKGETEMMLFFDYTSPSDTKREGGENNHISEMLEIKHNPTDQLALELMLEGFQDLGNGLSKFTGARYEARYRLFKENVPLNPTLYAEFEELDRDTRFKMETSGWINPPYTVEEEPAPPRESIMESRLILSQDFGRWTVAFNWINESDLHNGQTAFGYTMGALYRLRQPEEREHAHHHVGPHKMKPHKGLRPMTVAFEFFGALGDSRTFGFFPTRQEHYFQPSISFHLGENTMLGLGIAKGLSRTSDDLIRLTWGRKL